MVISDRVRRRLKVALANSSDADTVADALSGATAGSIAIYVDPVRGSDENSGEFNSPLLSIQAAVDLVPKNLRHPAVIHLAAGTYTTGAYLMGFISDPVVPANGAYIEIRGEMALSTLTTGSNTGTLTAASAGSAGHPVSHGTMTDSSQAWTTDNLRGKYLEITSGTQAEALIPIASNTATVITVVGTWTAPAVGSTYRIVEPAAVVTGSLADSDPSSINIPSGPTTDSGAHAFWCSSVTGADRTIVFSKIKINATNCIAVTDGSVRLDFCTVQPSSNGGRGITLFSFAHANSRRSIFNNSAGASTVSIGTMSDLFLTSNTMSHQVGYSSANCLYYSTVNAAHISIPVPCTITSNRDYFRSGYTAINVWSHATVNLIGTKIYGMTHGLYNDPLSNRPRGVGTVFFLQNCELSSCEDALDLVGFVTCELSGVTFVSNTDNMKLVDGTRIHLNAAVPSTVSAGNHIDLDGTIYTLTQLRAVTGPPAASITNSATLSRIWES